MNSHLTILANGKPLTLADDFSISVEMSNPLFNDVEMFSYPVEIPLEGNRHFLQNLDDPNSDIRPFDREHTPMQILADGMPLASGPSVMQEGEAIEDTLSLNIDASVQSLNDMIADLKCNEIPIPDKYHDQLLIGEKIDGVDVTVTYDTDAHIKYKGKKGGSDQGYVGENYTTNTYFSPQALGFSYPAKCVEEPDAQGNNYHYAQVKEQRTYRDGDKMNVPEVEESYINVDLPYPMKPFCNARVCYAHHDKESNGTTSDAIVQELPNDKEGNMYEDNGPLWVLEADRPQSGICFYVLFFLDCLFAHLSLTFDRTALDAIGDLRRLCFFTTKCAYDQVPLHYTSLYTEEDIEVQSGRNKVGDIKKGCFDKEVTGAKNLKNLFEHVNKWLETRGCGGKLQLDTPKDKNVKKIVYTPVIYQTTQGASTAYYTVRTTGEPVAVYDTDEDVESITARSTAKSARMSAGVSQMYANARNFPDETVSTVLSALENQFGIKFHYDPEQRKVTAYLIRDVFRRQNPQPRTFHAQDLSMVLVSEKITGVRAGYSAESDAQEQRAYKDNGVKDYNTDYDYIQYDKSRTKTDLTYRDIIHQVTSTNQNVYIDLQTGDKFRIKINSDFTSMEDMEPRLFEVAGNKGVEIGDCSPINEDFIREFISDFTPVSLVDVNYRRAQQASHGNMYAPTGDPVTAEGIPGNRLDSVNDDYEQTILAAFVDEDMEHEFIEQQIKNPISAPLADFYVTEVLSLVENYDPTKTEDGNSPLQTYDWGLSIAIMRGGGVDSTHESYDANYDGFGNSRWRTKAGKYALTTDSIDPYGNQYDYNGTEEGIGTEERFSLKPRAWVQPEWADAPLIVDDPAVKNRGYVDTFLIEYIHFLLHRKTFRVRCLATVAQIADIPNHWKEWWNIGGRKCLINKVNTDITVREGMGEVELEVYSL